MNSRTIQPIILFMLVAFSTLILAACQGDPDQVLVTRVVTSVAQEVIVEPTTVVVRDVTATPEPTAVPTNTPSPTPTPDLPLATNPIELVGHEDVINSIKFSPDSQLVLASSDDGTARIWDLQGNLRLTLTGHTERVTDAVFSPDGSLIVTSSDDKTARIWSVGGELLHVLEGHSSPVNSALFTPDGRFIITNAREPKIWDIDGNLLATLEGHRSIQVRSWVSPNGQYLLTTSGDATVLLWQISDAGEATLLTDLSEAATDGSILRNVFFLPDNIRFMTNSLDFIIWAIVPTGEVVQLATLGHPVDLMDINFADEDVVLLQSAGFEVIALQDSSDPDNPTYFEGHTSAIVKALFSPDKDYVVTGSNDHTARLWNLQGETLLIFTGSELPVRHVLVSPDENFVVTGDRDGFIQLWNISSLH